MAVIIDEKKTKNTFLSSKFESSRRIPVSVEIDQFICFPLPFIFAKGLHHLGRMLTKQAKCKILGSAYRILLCTIFVVFMLKMLLIYVIIK